VQLQLVMIELASGRRPPRLVAPWQIESKSDQAAIVIYV
jgi:hypothetical protein